VIVPTGHAYTRHYIIKSILNGSWMINGCYLLTRGDDPAR